jgi:hypothetical protein
MARARAARAARIGSMTASERLNTGPARLFDGLPVRGPMRYHEITAPTTHPYVITLTIDPCDFHAFERLTQDRDEVRLLRRDDRADKWLLHVACASRDVARRMEDGWGR